MSRAIHNLFWLFLGLWIGMHWCEHRFQVGSFAPKIEGAAP
jgi:hypothetical protein